jgi:hypothetical protein
MLLFTDHDFCHFLQDIEPAPLARTISYNIKGPISALGCRSPTLAQLISRYVVLDPILTSSASDKRKAPSLIAPPAVMKKRTSKKLLIQVRIPCPPEHNIILYSDHFISAWLQTRAQQPVTITDPADAASTGKIFTILLSIYFLYRHSSLTGQL